MRFAFVVAASSLALAAPAAFALQIQGYNAAVNERFSSGFEAGAPIANASASFSLSGYDLSGVGWRTNNNDFAVTLISDRHALTAAHVAPGVGSSVSFLGSDGVVRSYTVASVTVLSFNGVASDVAFVKLATAVDSEHIASYFGLGLSPAAYAGLQVTLYGANGRVGLNNIEAVGAFDMLPFSTGPGVPSGNGVNDSVIAYTDYDLVSGEAQGQGGDSGSPSFARMANGDLALVGIHSAVSTTSGGTQLTIDSLPLLASQTQINNLLAADLYGPWNYYISGVVAATIPEPASVATLAGLGAALAGGFRRRRRA